MSGARNQYYQAMLKVIKEKEAKAEAEKAEVSKKLDATIAYGKILEAQNKVLDDIQSFSSDQNKNLMGTFIKGDVEAGKKYCLKARRLNLHIEGAVKLFSLWKKDITADSLEKAMKLNARMEADFEKVDKVVEKLKGLMPKK